jgi:nicotinamidase-related amidase
MNINLFIIDPQVDFCNPYGSLFVPGSDYDMIKLSKFMSKNIDKINNLFVSLDTHHSLHIAHPVWWVDSNGNNPPPFTQITLKDLKNGKWKTSDPKQKESSYSYVKNLELNSKKVLCVWPPHCVIGSPGHSIVSVVFDAINKWEHINKKATEFVMKGSSIGTEHYSAFKADVAIQSDSRTYMNFKLLDKLYSSTSPDLILISGEASSHCVASTVLDMINFITDEVDSDNILNVLKKIVILKDTMSPVPGFEKDQEDFFCKAMLLGARIMTTEEVENIINEDI